MAGASAQKAPAQTDQQLVTLGQGGSMMNIAGSREYMKSLFLAQSLSFSQRTSQVSMPSSTIDYMSKGFLDPLDAKIDGIIDKNRKNTGDSLPKSKISARQMDELIATELKPGGILNSALQEKYKSLHVTYEKPKITDLLCQTTYDERKTDPARPLVDPIGDFSERLTFFNPDAIGDYSIRNSKLPREVKEDAEAMGASYVRPTFFSEEQKVNVMAETVLNGLSAKIKALGKNNPHGEITLRQMDNLVQKELQPGGLLHSYLQETGMILEYKRPSYMNEFSGK